MRRAMIGIGVAAALAATSSGLLAQEKDLALFAWLAGAWETTQANRVVEELWTTPTANAMIGMSRAIVGDRTAEFEFLRIEKRGTDLFYIPQPNGKPPVLFKLTSSDGGRFVFENATGDDRARRIEYRRDGEDGLVARVEGAQDGKPFALEFRYRRRK